MAKHSALAYLGGIRDEAMEGEEEQRRLLTASDQNPLVRDLNNER